MTKFVAIQRLRMLHGDRGGQSIIFVALVLLVLVSFMALVINVGHRAGQKVEMQLGTDAAALSGGTWIARGLNTTAMLNVSMTEALAWIIFLKAHKRTYDVARITHIANAAAATALCAFIFTAPVGCPWRVYLGIVKGLLTSIYKPSADKVNPTVTKLWTFMKNLRNAENKVTDIMGVVANVSATSVAYKNISNLMFPAALLPVGSTLPTKPGSFNDICERTHEGGPGYDNFFDKRAPINMKFLFMEVKDWFVTMWAPVSVMIPPPALMYFLFVRLQSNSLCPGKGSSSEEIDHYTVSVSACGANSGESKWTGGVYEVDGPNSDTTIDPATEPGNIITLIIEDEDGNRLTDPDTSLEIPDKTLNGRDFGEVNLIGSIVPALTGEGTLMRPSPALYPNSWCRCDHSTPDTGTVGSYIGEQRTTAVHASTIGGGTQDNPGANTSYYKATRTYYVYDGSREVDDFDNSKPPKKIGSHTEYDWSQHTESRYYKEEWTMTKCVYTSTETSSPEDTSGRAKPLVLADDWEDATNYLVLVYKSVEDQFTLGSATGGGNGMGTIALAQVKVSNASGEDDLFNQDWHARLAPVNLNQITTNFVGSGNLVVKGVTIPIGPKIKEFLANSVGTMVVH